jgi:quercetin dioxygenase-like cupin family protein
VIVSFWAQSARPAEKAEAGPSAPQKAAVREAAPISLQRYADAEVQKSPWGTIRWLMNSKIDRRAEMTLGVVEIAPRQSNPLHVHPNSAEYLHVLAGSCEHRVGDKWVRVKAGDTLRIPQGVPHMARTAKEACRAMILYDTGERQMVPVEEK